MKKLYKTAYDKKVDGVCNGLSEYLNVDVSLIRLAVFGLSLLSMGTGLLVYIAAMLILPVKQFPGDVM